MRLRWLLLSIAIALLTLTYSATALRHQLQEEENQSTKNGHSHTHGERQARRRNKNNAAAALAAARQANRQQHRSAANSDEDHEEDDEEEQLHQQTHNYDWNTHDDDANIDDSFEAAVEPLKTQTVPFDIFTCCNKVTGSCRTACENLSLVQSTASSASSSSNSNGNNGAAGAAGEPSNINYNHHRQHEPRLELKKYCRLHQSEFWSCVNGTLEAIARGADWSGRRCCQFGILQHCRNACATSASRADLQSRNGVCRRSDEQQLYDCLEGQEAADSCCGQARTSECLQACRAVFDANTNTLSRAKAQSNGSEHLQLETACGERNADVLQCIYNHTDLRPLTNAQQYLPCCDYSDKESCRQTCRALLQQQNATRNDVMFERLEAADCGKPLPYLPFWQCFLTLTRKLYVPAGNTQQTEQQRQLAASGGGELSQLGIDAAKRQCCEQARSNECRSLCTDMYSNDWWRKRDIFESKCLEQPGELGLRRCLASVEAPCELGCDGLSFCTNFNNRPTELFRSCTTAHDAVAREDLRLLQQRGYIRVLGLQLHIKNTTRCAPDKWQALICALQLQPCTRVGLYNGICREDCNELLEQCLDWTQQQQEQQPQRADAICARLQPSLVDDDGPPPCNSLRAYLERGDAALESAGHYGLTSSCKSKPCNGSELCVPQRNGSQGYSCIPACSLGQDSNLLAPFGAYVRLGKISSNPSTGVALAGGQPLMAEHLVCRCGKHGHVEQCQPLPSYNHAPCMLSGARSFRHGKSFQLECNLCSCFAGEITCTKQQCRLPGYTDASYTSLPCNCPAHYVPVCGSNGNTYASACVAKCLGLQETNYVYGACNVRNACGSGAHDCPKGTQCVEKRQICLSSMQRPCLQYICVNASAENCALHHTNEVCDASLKTHANACALVRSRGKLAYWGSCYASRCGAGSDEPKPVCGINGVTYSSHCAAWADYVLVDYVGRCREVGLLAADLGRRCRTVKCPAPVSKHCRHIVPPGACCPLCAGGAFRIIYSRKQLDRAMYGVREQRSSLLTLHSVLQELDRLVQINECQLTGFLTMEVGIFVALVPHGGRPTRLQLEACAREAEKLSSLITSQSPRITTNLALSSLIVSHMVEPTLPSSGVSVHGSAILAWLLGLVLPAVVGCKWTVL